MNKHLAVFVGNLRFIALTILGIGILSVFTSSAYADEGHHYTGDSEFGTEFFLIGGQYHLYVNAHQNYVRATSRHLSCAFAGHFSRTAPTTDTLTMGPTQIATLGYTLDRQLTLPPGLYRFHVATDCPWNFFISSTADNTAGLAQVQMLITPGGKAQLSTTASLSDRLHFSADFRTDHNANEPVSGTLQIIHDGKVVGTLPLQSGVGLPIRGQVVFAELKWEQADNFLRPNIAKFIVKIGPTEFTSSAEFTLTR